MYRLFLIVEVINGLLSDQSHKRLSKAVRDFVDEVVYPDAQVCVYECPGAEQTHPHNHKRQGKRTVSDLA